MITDWFSVDGNFPHAQMVCDHVTLSTLRGQNPSFNGIYVVWKFVQGALIFGVNTIL